MTTTRNNTSSLVASSMPPADMDNQAHHPHHPHHPRHAHSVRFYDDDAFLLDEVIRFIGAALRAGEGGLVIATPEHRAELARRLREGGPDQASARGRYISLDAAETLALFMRDGWPNAALFADHVGGMMTRATAAATGAPRVAAFGEMVALLWAGGQPEAALRLEHLWDELAQTHAFTLQCAYPMRLFRHAGDGEPLEKICAAHAHVMPAESYAALTTDEERGRAITLLQHKALALDTEIEERTAAQASLHAKDRELRVAAAARDDFLSVAAHELQTPVTSLRLVAQLLLREARRARAITPERLESALDIVDRQTGKLKQVVSRVLVTARIDAGELRIAPKRTDLVALARAVSAAYRDEAEHTIVVECPARLEAMVDPVQFEHVIDNLVENAVRFSPHGGIVTVALGHGADGGIRLSVTDQGIGIPPQHRDAVFERFHQAHEEMRLSGMGLGLYMTREIVALHGGVVWLEEQEHGGTRVVVTLPPATGGAPAERGAGRLFCLRGGKAV